MTDFDANFQKFALKMEQEDLPDVVIRTFRHYYGELTHGVTGIIRESALTPVHGIADAENLGDDLGRLGRAEIPKTVTIKLNGGLGTSMGLETAKSLLQVKDNLTFLDIIARQALTNKTRLVLMNSFATRDDSLSRLSEYPELFGDIPVDFLQHKVPKIRQEDLAPATFPEDPQLEWCPPGHGDLYTAMVTSGILETLWENGYRYCFVSNPDNLGAVLDERILAYLVATHCPFLMEVADRTESDRKGGHIARQGDRLILREAAQCAPSDWEDFQNIHRHAYFNTNNLWIDLEALRELLRKSDNVIRLPMIRNSKTIDPKDPKSTPVYQLETAMGAAISVFKGSEAVRVPRTRFSPVKTCLDLLAVRSDLTILTPSFCVQPNPQRELGPFQGTLDDRYYRNLSDLEERFPFGPPSLIRCSSLEIQGDFLFADHTILEGEVKLVNQTGKQAQIPEGAEIEGLVEI